MPSAAELRDGDLLLRPWRESDVAAVGVGPGDDGEVGGYFGAPVGGFATEPDPEAPWFATRSLVAERAGFRRDGVVENYAHFKDGETTALRYVWP
jgi:RimJ/RimL family protein N-acetyltransferase